MSKVITVTPGTAWYRYATRPEALSDLAIVESDEGVGFEFAGFLAAQEAGEVVKGLILADGRLEGIISGAEEWTHEDVLGKRTTRSSKSLLPSESRDAQERPYMFVTTSVPTPGYAILGPDRIINVMARGLDAGGAVSVRVDGDAVQKAAQVAHDGTLRTTLSLKKQLLTGMHTVEVVEESEPTRVLASGAFVTRTFD